MNRSIESATRQTSSRKSSRQTRQPMSDVPAVLTGTGLRADRSATIGYPASRGETTSLSVGADAHVRSGSAIYVGSRIGVNATILPFARIGAGCLIGAGAVVVLDIPAHCVAFGNPAVVRGRVGDLKSIEDRVEAVSGSASRFRRAHPATTVRLNGRGG